MPEYCAMNPKRVFIREATGLVRQVSLFDAFANNLGATGIAFGLVVYMWDIGFVSGANVPLCLLISFIFATFLIVPYALLNSAMPRSGGDYVYTSRIIHPVIGFMGSFTQYYSQLIWLPLSTSMVISYFIATSVATLGLVSNDNGLLQLATVLGQPLLAFVIGAIILVLIALASIAGIRTYFRTQNIVFWIGLVATIPMIYILLTSSNLDFINVWNRSMAAFTNSTDSYHSIINSAKQQGFDPYGFSWWGTFAGVPAMFGTLAFTFFSSYYGGEIKGATSVKRQMMVMWLSLLFISVAVGGIGILMESVAGHPFLSSLFWLYSTNPQALGSAPVAPYFNLFVLMLTQNRIVQYIIIIGFVAWGLLMPIIEYMYLTQGSLCMVI